MVSLVVRPRPRKAPTRPDWTCPHCGQRYVNRNQVHSCARQSIEAFFADDKHNRRLYDALHQVLASLGPVEVYATKTQIAFRARVRFAYLWFPNRVRGSGPPILYLTFDLRRRQRSPRIMESVNPRADLWTHHVPFRTPTDLDSEVRGWLTEAYATAITPPDRRIRGS